jgi:hypothetical protein
MSGVTLSPALPTRRAAADEDPLLPIIAMAVLQALGQAL